MIGDKTRMKGYRNKDRWLTRKKENSEKIREGTQICRQMYIDMLDNNLEVVTVFDKITKKFIRKDGESWKACWISEERIEKILG
jgi:hypothetical protein